MNSKGQVLIYSMMLGLLIIIFSLALAPSVNQFTNESITSMDCSNDSISNFYKAGCTAIDLGGFYFIGALILIGGGFITYKLVF